jgi:hypothetical protein
MRHWRAPAALALATALVIAVVHRRLPVPVAPSGKRKAGDVVVPGEVDATLRHLSASNTGVVENAQALRPTSGCLGPTSWRNVVSLPASPVRSDTRGGAAPSTSMVNLVMRFPDESAAAADVAPVPLLRQRRQVRIQDLCCRTADVREQTSAQYLLLDRYHGCLPRQSKICGRLPEFLLRRQLGPSSHSKRHDTRGTDASVGEWIAKVHGSSIAGMRG